MVEMKKRIWVLLLILFAVLALYIYSSARQAVSLPKPEDMTGQEASAFLPAEVKGVPAAQGSSDLKVSGPVWVDK